MVKEVIYCGECEKFLYEDTDGFGVCGKTNEECRCSDKCHLINGKPWVQEADTIGYLEESWINLRFITLGFIGMFSIKRQQGSLEQFVENASLEEGCINYQLLSE